jgi:EmrB/QacA subfamily drug resistance transporter
MNQTEHYKDQQTSRSSRGGLDTHVLRTGIVVVLGTIMAILDSTIVAVALSRLAGDLHASLSTIQWVTTAYLLSLAVVIPVSGWAVHRIGAKPVYMAALALFVAGSALCGLAWSATALIGFRVLQGLGGGMIQPVGQTLMARSAGPDKMGRVMAVLGIPTMLGPILGPVLGGLIISNFSWRWIFYVNLPIGLVALAAAWKFLPRPSADKGHRFDLVGFLTLSPGLALVVYGLAQVSGAAGLRSSKVLDPVLVGLFLMGVFVWRSLRATEPLIDMRLFKRRNFTVATVNIFLTGAVLYGAMFLLPLYFEIVRGMSPWQAGLWMAPQGLGAAVVMRKAGILADERGPRRMVPLGMAVMAMGTLAFCLVRATTNLALLGGALFVRGVGLGLAMMPVIAASYRGLAHDEVPRATAATSIVRQVGGSIGVAMFSAVLTSALAARFGTTSVSLSATGHLPVSVAGEIAGAFGQSYWWAFGATVLAVVPSLFLPSSGRAAVSEGAPSE